MNRLTAIGDSLRNAKDLATLWVADNELTDLSSGCLRHFRHLTELNAAKNSIPTVLGAFDNNPELRVPD